MFCERLLEHWRARPAVWRARLPRALLTEPELFDVLLAASASASANGGSAVPVRAYRERELLPSADALLPIRADRSLDGYYRRIRRQLGGARFGIVVSDVQVLDLPLWERTTCLLRELYARTGTPIGGAQLDLFLGDYEVTPFGIHKDCQDVITFPIRGEKSFLTWEYEALCPLVGVGGEMRMEVCRAERLDHRELRERATVLRGEPGDAMYFPCEYWHVAESTGTLSASLGLGVLPGGTPMRLAARAEDRARRREPADAFTAPTVAALRDALDAALDRPAFRTAYEEIVLEAISGFGFERTPAPSSAGSICEEDWIEGAPNRTLAWLRSGDSLVWAATGRSCRWPYSDVLVRLFEIAACSKRRRVRDVLSDVLGEQLAEPRLTQRMVRALEVLAQAHAIRVVPALPTRAA
jgi:hypothetical protein